MRIFFGMEFHDDIHRDFHGAKMLLMFGGKMVTLLRDDVAHSPFADMWDLPGGGREGAETPLDCVLRETFEELLIHVPRAAIMWHDLYPSITNRDETSYFFAAHLPAQAAQGMQIGNEGQCWALVDAQTWLNSPRAITSFKARVQDGLAALQTLRS